MATQNDIIELLKNSLITIKTVLGNVDELEKNLENVSLNGNFDEKDLLKKTKQVIDSVYEKSCETRSKFYETYNNVVKNNGKEPLVQTTSSEYEDALENVDSHTQNNIAQEPSEHEDVNSEVSDSNGLDNGMLNEEENKTNTEELSDCEVLCKNDHVIQNIEESDNVEKLKKKNSKSSKGSKKVDESAKVPDEQSNAEKYHSDEEKSNTSAEESNNVEKLKKKNSKSSKSSKKVDKSAKAPDEQSNAEKYHSDEEKSNTSAEESNNVEKLKKKNSKSSKSSKKVDNSAKVPDEQSNAEKCHSDEDKSNTSISNESNGGKSAQDRSDEGEQTNILGDLTEESIPSSENKKSKNNHEVNDENEKHGETKDSDSGTAEASKEGETIEKTDEQSNVSLLTDDFITLPDSGTAEASKEGETIEKTDEQSNVSLANFDKETSDVEKAETNKNSEEVIANDDNSVAIGDVEIKPEPDKRPLIRLVSIDKLMEKPKKTVTFDTSVIVLSSDDESSPKKTVESSNEKLLKSALKTTSPKAPLKDLNKNIDDSEKSSDDEPSRKSSRLRTKADEKNEQRSRLKSIFVRTKKNEWKGKKASDLGGEDGTSKRKKKNLGRISDSSDDDQSDVIRKGIMKRNPKLVIRLPRVECEKLKDICLTNNVFSSERFMRKRKKEEDEVEDSEHSKKKSKDISSGSEEKANKDEETNKNKSNNSSSSDEKLDTVEIESSDSDNDFTTKTKLRSEKKKKKKVISDSEDDCKQDKDEGSSDDSKSSNSKDDTDSDKETNKNSERRRIQRTNDSSDSDDERSTRKQIRRLIGKDSLSETTKRAEAEEKERKARIAEKQKKYNAIIGQAEDASVEKVILEIDEKTEKELLSIDPKVAKKLKPHQASGIRFMWDACFESLERAKSTSGSGCILAHCMGLGKTLQVIALSHTLLQNSEKTGVNKILVVCPVNTVLNWKAEFKKWLPKKTNFDIYELVSCKQMSERKYKLSEWHSDGGVLIIGYTMFRNISNPDNKKIQKHIRSVFIKSLVDPGPDLVICDEGHLLKNEKTNLSIAMNRIKTNRRIVLTGTPLQNNLKEYWCMVQFIKPNLLGTYKEYLNRFVNPITNGQYTDSTQHDIILMRKRSHVLHKLLDGVVQRRDYSVLAPYLPPKHEYVLFVRLSDVQVKLCQHYMDNYSQRKNSSSKVSFIFTDFQQLQMIGTHPRVLFSRSQERKENYIDEDEDVESEGSLKDFIDDGEATSSPASASSSSGSDSESEDSNKSKKKGKRKEKKQQKTRLTRAQAAHRRENGEESDPEIIEVAPREWWQDFCDGDELDNINNSGKLNLLFHLLKECEEIGDKILIFSQSLYTLNCIEYFLEKIDEATRKGETEKFGGYSGNWDIGLDYFRLDGSSSCDNRASWCDSFNNPENTRARLFLISTKAGGLGINLVAANRVIIFDVSWNPSHDIQSIYRVYRFGQTKPSYIYRFVTYGAMEMKIYERQVTKQAISKRVIDEQQIDRHYNQNDLQELYKCEFIPKEERPIPLVPKDVLLGEMLQKYDKVIYKYHEHQSLLENKEHEGLNEEERKAAWDEFENEKILRKNTYTGAFGSPEMGMGMGINAPLIAMALANIVRRDNPTWPEVQINGIIPALVQQLKVQLSENDTSMFARVQQEMQRMQVEAREAEFQRQMMQMYAQNHYLQIARQQQLQNSNMGNMQIKPSALRQIYNNIYPGGPNPAASGSRNRPAPSNDVIELVD